MAYKQDLILIYLIEIDILTYTLNNTNTHSYLLKLLEAKFASFLIVQQFHSARVIIDSSFLYLQKLYVTLSNALTFSLLNSSIFFLTYKIKPPYHLF